MNKNITLITSICTVILIPLVLSYILISYIKSLENTKCKCSEDVRRKYIKFYGYALLVLTILGLFIILLTISFPKILIIHQIIKYLSVFVNILGIYIIYSYSDILSSSDCDCSQSWKRVFLKYYSYIMITLIGLSFLLLVIVFILHIITGNEKSIISIKNGMINC